MLKEQLHKKQLEFSRKLLIFAAIYNLVWGGWVLIFPQFFHSLFGLAPLHDVLLWQCIGMFVGVFGLGYAITAINPERFWPMILVGLLGKIAGITGYVGNTLFFDLDPKFGFFILTNDLVWIYPFGVILYWIYQSHINETENALTPSRHEVTLSNGQTLYEFSKGREVIVVFVRHAGCTFCREVLYKISLVYPNSESRKDLVIAHLGSEEEIKPLLEKYHIQDVVTLSDPERVLYKSAGLKRGSLSRLFGPREFILGITGILQGHGVAFSSGDPFQLGGVALMKDGVFKHIEPHQRASDTSVSLCRECVV
jgi:hypothetical protein